MTGFTTGSAMAKATAEASAEGATSTTTGMITAANGALERFAVNKRGVGMERAKKKLNEELEGLLTEHFVLPASKAPKSNRDWALLGERREAAEIVVKCYALGTHKALGFGADRVAVVVEETEGNFRQFGECTKDGEYYGYAVLARKIGQIIHDTVEVDTSGATEPVFGKTMF